MAKFNVLSLLNNNSKGENKEKIAAKTEMLSIHSLEPSSDNFYDTSSIEELKDSIELFGLKQQILVKKIGEKIGENKYRVIAGHRRRLAVLALVEEGKTQFEMVPCQIEDISGVAEKILLIHTNSTSRVLSDWEKVEQLRMLKELLTEYKKTNKIPGRMRELLAETLNISPTQVGRLETIDKNLVPEAKAALKNQEISFSKAVEIAKLPEAEQKKEVKKEIVPPGEKVKEKIAAEYDEKTILFKIAAEEIKRAIENGIKSLKTEDEKSKAKKEIYTALVEKLAKDYKI